MRILQSDWFWEKAVFSYLLTMGMVTNYAKRRVKLQIERAKFQNMTKTKTKTKQKHWQLRACILETSGTVFPTTDLLAGK